MTDEWVAPRVVQSDMELIAPHTIDGEGIKCGLSSNGCSHAMAGHGGFDEHHRWPRSLGGPENPDDLLILCPNHHRRQHALVRYLVENLDPHFSVLVHFTQAEQLIANYAVTRWRMAGKPHIAGWPCPAAT